MSTLNDLNALQASIAEAVLGQDQVIRQILLGLLANGQAVFFDALNPGVVPLPNVTVHVAGNEISATVPLAGSDTVVGSIAMGPASGLLSLSNTGIAVAGASSATVARICSKALCSARASSRLPVTA